jgi:hypothetical protein
MKATSKWSRTASCSDFRTQLFLDLTQACTSPHYTSAFLSEGKSVDMLEIRLVERVLHLQPHRSCPIPEMNLICNEWQPLMAAHSTPLPSTALAVAGRKSCNPSSLVPNIA